jgi:ABC-type bacteriocin/lantibiotic exporter with double-glycine peptidase domain
MLARFYGLPAEPDQVAEWARTTDQGTHLVGMLEAAQRLQLSAFYKDDCSIADLTKWIAVGVPPIVDWFFEVTGHYSLVVDIDSQEKTITLRDPIQPELRVMDLQEFQDVWFDFDTPQPEKDSFFVRRAIIALPPPMVCNIPKESRCSQG